MSTVGGAATAYGTPEWRARRIAQIRERQKDFLDRHLAEGWTEVSFGVLLDEIDRLRAAAALAEPEG